MPAATPIGGRPARFGGGPEAAPDPVSAGIVTLCLGGFHQGDDLRLEEHLSAVSSRRGDEDPAVESAVFRMIDAFEEYEDALYDTYGEVTPLDVYDDDEDEDGDYAEDADLRG